MLAEQSLINEIAHQLQAAGQPAVLGDDCFFEPSLGRVYSTDGFVEDRHFSLQTFSWADVGWKTAAAAISDVAAMGAELCYLLVSLGVPQHATAQQVSQLYQGVLALLAHLQQGQLVGGDTIASPSLSLTHTVVGQVPAGHHVGLRSGAKPGDCLITTGPHGLSALGLRALQNNWSQYPTAVEKHRRPIPKIKQGLEISALVNCIGSRYALMDSSDGLADACLKLATQSGVELVLEEAALPWPEELLHFAQKTSEVEALELMLYGGEDFELVACVPPQTWELLKNQSPDWVLIGHVQQTSTQREPQGLAWLNPKNGPPLQPLSAEKTYQHFNSTGDDGGKP